MQMKHVGRVGRRSVSGIGMALGLLWSSGAQAATFMWNNTGTDYNSASSWTNNAVPGAADDVIITNSGSMTQPNLTASITNRSMIIASNSANYVITSSSPSIKLTLVGQGGSAGQAIDIRYIGGTTNTIDAPLVLGGPAGTTNRFSIANGANGVLVINGNISEMNSGICLLANAGLFKLMGDNTFTGDPVISGSGSSVTLSKLGNAGSSGGLGMGNIIHMYGTLRYIGAGETSSKVIDANGSGAGRLVTIDTTGATGALILTSDMTLSGSGTNTFTLTGDSAGNEFRGKIVDGASMMNIFQKNGTGAWTVSGANTFSGGSKLIAGTFIFGNKSALGVGGVDVGKITMAASTNLTGANSITNPLFLSQTYAVVAGSNSFEFSGPVTNTVSSSTLTNNMTDGSVKFSGNVYLSSTEAATRGITLKGSGTTIISGNIASSHGVNTNVSWLTCDNTGITRLAGSNTFSGDLTVNSGVVILDNNNAVPGGIGSTGGKALLKFSGTGVVGLGTGDFTRSTGTASNQVQWSAGGGFAAYGANRIVNLGGTSAQVSWGLNGFVSAGDPLILGASSADATVDFQNPISLVTATRTIQANRGSAAIDGTMSGVISANSAAYGIIKTGNGVLALGAANTFGGGATVSNGTLLVNNATGSGTGTGTVQVVTGATLGGTGTVAGVVNIADGATLSPGIPGSVGTLYLSSNLTFSGTSATYTCNYSPGTCDSVQVGGTITFPATINLNVSGSGLLNTDGVLFSFQSKVGTPAWNITPSGSYTVVATSSNYVLKASSRGCLMVIQ